MAVVSDVGVLFVICDNPSVINIHPCSFFVRNNWPRTSIAVRLRDRDERTIKIVVCDSAFCNYTSALNICLLSDRHHLPFSTGDVSFADCRTCVSHLGARNSWIVPSAESRSLSNTGISFCTQPSIFKVRIRRLVWSLWNFDPFFPRFVVVLSARIFHPCNCELFDRWYVIFRRFAVRRMYLTSTSFSIHWDICRSYLLPARFWHRIPHWHARKRSLRSLPVCFWGCKQVGYYRIQPSFSIQSVILTMRQPLGAIRWRSELQ